MKVRQSVPAVEQSPVAYDPPRIELVLTAHELEREVLYAGASSPAP